MEQKQSQMGKDLNGHAHLLIQVLTPDVLRLGKIVADEFTFLQAHMAIPICFPDSCGRRGIQDGATRTYQCANTHVLTP